MREYAFASDDKTYAQDIYTQDDGILYEITVPKGARIADDWNYIFPRESMFLCTQNDVVKENNKNFLIEIDGGINQTNYNLCKKVGCDIVVIGTYFFKDDNYEKTIKELEQYENNNCC